MKTLILIAITLFFASTNISCGKSRADDAKIELQLAPDGSSCYIIIQNGDAKGGNCK